MSTPTRYANPALICCREVSIERTDETEQERSATLSLSSETPVAYGEWREVLVHEGGAIRLERLRTLGAVHLYHDTTRPVAAIRDLQLADRRLVARVAFGSTAEALDAWALVRDGILRGVSVGFRVHKWELDEEAKIARAVDWEPYELSLTSIPADASVGVGRDLDHPPAAPAGADTARSTPMAEPATPAPAAAGPDEKQRAAELARENDLLKREMRLTKLATSHGVSLEGLDLRSLDEGAVIDELLKRAAAAKPAPAIAPASGLTVSADGEDKRRDAAVDGLLAATFGRRDLEALGHKADLGMRRLSPCGILRALIPGAERLDADQLARFATRQDLDRLSLRDANQSAANFTTVLGNYMDKAVLVGFNQTPITHVAWTSERLVDDFKTVYGAALVAGLLKEQTSNGVPAEEMNLTEKNYSAALGLFFRTLSLTYQDWRNDDLGLFAGQIANAGRLAAATEDWQVYKTLLAASWTGYITTSAAFYDTTNDRLIYDGFTAVQGAFEQSTVTVGSETIPVSPTLGAVLCPTKWVAPCRAILGGQINGAPAAVGGAIPPVISSPWLANSSLTGYSTDDYYLIAGNMDSIKVLRDRLNPQPVVRQIPAGATPDMKYLVMHAFRPVIASMSGMRKGDWA